MPYNAEPGGVAYVVAGVTLNHGDLGCDQNFCGVAVKLATPAADTARNLRIQIPAGEPYLLRIDGVVEGPATGPLAGVTKGTLVYIAEADNSLSLAPGAGKIVLGKVASLPGERGTPANKVRINAEQKV